MTFSYLSARPELVEGRFFVCWIRPIRQRYCFGKSMFRQAQHERKEKPVHTLRLLSLTKNRGRNRSVQMDQGKLFVLAYVEFALIFKIKRAFLTIIKNVQN
jgi:hypothetical protein